MRYISARGLLVLALGLLVIASNGVRSVRSEGGDEDECKQLTLGSLHEGYLSPSERSHCFEIEKKQLNDGNNTFQILFADRRVHAAKYLCSTVTLVQTVKSDSNSSNTTTTTTYHYGGSMCEDVMRDSDIGYCFNVDKSDITSILINITCLQYDSKGNLTSDNCQDIDGRLEWAMRVYRDCLPLANPPNLTWLVVLAWILVVVILLFGLRYFIRRYRRTTSYEEIGTTTYEVVHDHSSSYPSSSSSSFVPQGTTAPVNPSLRSFMGYTAPPQK